MKELKYLDYTKGNEGHILIPSCKSVYPDMGVGTAQQIQTNIHENDSTPYVFRPTPYNSTRESGDIVGASVAWNQLNNPNGGTTAGGVTFTLNNNGTYTATNTGTSGATVNIYATFPVITGHKYVLTLGGFPLAYSTITGSTKSYSADTIVEAGTTGNVYFRPRTENGTTYNITFSLNCVDLTLALGSTIADYIYTLESGTAGAGVAKLREWGFFTKPYYAYNAGSIESVNVSKHIMRDGDNNIIGEYPLDSDLTLRGILKLDGSNNLYADGDVYEADGTVDRNFGEYTFTGDETWSASGSGYSCTVINSLIKPTANNNTAADYIVIPNLEVKTRNEITGGVTTGNYIAVGANGALFITADVYNNRATLLTGKSIVFKLATPTTETADPYNEVQVCSPYGTEEFVDAGVAAGTRDVSIPVGHNTEYMKNIVGAIEGIPLPPSANGTYTLKVTVASGVPTYSWVSE